MKRFVVILFYVYFTIATTFAQDSGIAPKYSIHETQNTKTFVVNSLNITDFELGACYNGVFSILERNTQKAFVFDKMGNLLSSFQNKGLPVFEDGEYACVKPDGAIREIIRKDGTVIKRIKGVIKMTPFYDGVSFIHYALEETGRFINVKGEFIYPNLAYPVDEYRKANGHLKDGLRIFQSNRKIGFIDANGKIIIQAKYCDAEDFSEGLAAAAIEEGYQKIWGFIDTKGEFAITPKFNIKPSSFHNGFAVVQKRNGTFVYIDRKGQVVSPEYEYATSFYKGFAWVNTDFVIPNPLTGTTPKATIIDESFNEVRTINRVILRNIIGDLDNIIIIYPKECVYSVDGDLLLYDKDVCFLKGEDDLIGYYSTGYRDGVTMYYKDCGYINPQGEIIIRFVENGF